MSYLYLVRHGQADRLGKDYDQLTQLGYTQAENLGAYFLRQNIEFDSTFTGSLRRQKQTCEGILSVLTKEGFCVPQSIENPNWDEFDSRMWLSIAAKIRNVDTDFAATYEKYKSAWENQDELTRDYFQVLIQKVLRDWVLGTWGKVEPYTFPEYVSRIQSALEAIPRDCKSTLIVTSSTPVAIAMGLATGIAYERFPIFMKYILNSSLSVFKREGNNWEPVSFNSTPHLAPDQITIV
ncbi:phosphatase [Leptospira ryugenii]|uniref:Phosphatase n=1 Tax=Leptospira ryugenii TaxID=1917863 RepID=A0A2P2E3I0_9LEPT|nr:histidine phosphatase family protein [Leptospira ryugenii]GBF51448.1 phosphatase [Leptospira ryugenii]